jgi:hypothetical protein
MPRLSAYVLAAILVSGGAHAAKNEGWSFSGMLNHSDTYSGTIMGRDEDGDGVLRTAEVTAFDFSYSYPEFGTFTTTRDELTVLELSLSLSAPLVLGDQSAEQLRFQKTFTSGFFNFDARTPPGSTFRTFVAAIAVPGLPVVDSLSRTPIALMPIPEPSTLALWFVGAGLLAARRVKR